VNGQDGGQSDGGVEEDEELIFAELRRVIGASDPVPTEVVEAAIASHTWRRVDSELAELVYDSLMDGALVRGGEGERQLTFEADELTMEVEVGPAALHGQIVPPQRAAIELRHPGGSLTVAADQLGHFVVDPIPHGPVSFRCQPETRSRATVTSWVVI